MNDEWGRQAAEANAKLLAHKGVKIISIDYFLPGESEFGATLATIKAATRMRFLLRQTCAKPF